MNSWTDEREIKAAAASWDVRLRSPACKDSDRAAFKAWRGADSRHEQAFDRLQLALKTLRRGSDHPELRALRERAELMTRGSSVRHAVIAVSMVAAVAAIVLTAGLLVRHLRAIAITQRGSVMAPSAGMATRAVEQAYVTGPRERQIVTLPDGSSATLNASTRLEAVWLPRERRIRLVSGQALFRVSKDPTRPFTVTAGDRTVTAVGTTFDVRLDADKVQVTLLEGRVAVRGIGRAAHQPVLELTPSQQLVAIDGDIPTVQVTDVARSTGWADGRVFFTDEELPAAVAEMNRYSSQEIVVGDPSLARYRVNGMFRSGNQDGFVGALTSYFPIDTHQDSRGRIVLEPRPERSRRK